MIFSLVQAVAPWHSLMHPSHQVAYQNHKDKALTIIRRRLHVTLAAQRDDVGFIHHKVHQVDIAFPLFYSGTRSHTIGQPSPSMCPSIAGNSFLDPPGPRSEVSAPIALSLGRHLP